MTTLMATPTPGINHLGTGGVCPLCGVEMEIPCPHIEGGAAQCPYIPPDCPMETMQ